MQQTAANSVKPPVCYEPPECGRSPVRTLYIYLIEIGLGEVF